MRSAALAAACAVSILLSGCSGDLEREAARYHKNTESVERFIRQYPQLARFLKYELEKARSLWYGSWKAGDLAGKRQMIAQANKIIYRSPLLGYLHSYDGRRTRINRNIKIIEPYGEDGKFRVRVRRVVKNTRRSLDGAVRLMSLARPATEQSAVDLVRRADEMLVKPEAQVLRLKKAIRDEKFGPRAIP